MQQKIKYYVTGHTAEGFVNYLTSNVMMLDKIIVLQHPSNVIKTNIFQRLIAYYRNKGTIEILSSPEGKAYIDGIILRDLSLAIVTNPDDQPLLERSIDINLEAYCKGKMSLDTIKGIKKLKEQAYHFFQTGLRIHDDLEKIYINEMNFTRADEVAATCIAEIFHDVQKKDGDSIIYERLFGTNTPDGMINYVEDLTAPMKRRIFIKGRAGTGKSVLMKKVLQACMAHGLDVELYRCSFDPNSIDMLIVRKLGLCLFDSTPPHEFFPTRKTDEIIDLYEKAVTAGTDEKYSAEINRLTKAYKQEMKNGLKALEKTKALTLSVEHEWATLNEKVYDTILDEIFQRL